MKKKYKDKEPLKKIKIQAVQFNNSYDKNVFIPYSVGVLQAFSQKYRRIKEHFEFLPYLYRRGAVEELAKKASGADILCVSCYMWNWKLNMALLARVRRLNERCLIIVGGPQVPDEAENLFKEHSEIDIAIHGEGEETFHEILNTYLQRGDFRGVKGMSYHDRRTGEFFYGGMRPEIARLDDIPSPYLTGVFDRLMADDKADWVASWETNRGCPFSCTYCYWGRRSQTLRNFSMDRLFAEIEWFGQNDIPLIFGCDANFGISKRDLDLVKRLAGTKKKHGYPQTFRVCNMKNSNDVVFDVEKVLHESCMSKGTSISFQSLSPKVLHNVKRKNIRIDLFHTLQKRYMKAGMPTYTEIIIALPGETYETFVNGINTLLENGQHSQLHLYNCTILVNSEMGQESYLKKYGIKTVEGPIFQQHVTPDTSVDRVTEYEKIVVTTDAMSLADWRRTYEFAWAVLCFHCLGIFQMISVLIYGRYRISYRVFYESLVIFAKSNPKSLIGRELIALNDILDNVLKGIGFDQFLPEFGEVNWPSEEATFLRLSNGIDLLYGECRQFLKSFFKAQHIKPDLDILNDLLKYQRQRLVHYDDDYNSDHVFVLNFNIVEYINAVMQGESCSLRRGKKWYRIVRDQNFNGDKKRFAREAVWYGRKGGKFLYAVYSIAKPVK
ncbi:MAG: radical SAM protein [Candidatus Omnitrophota bacterium]